MTTISIDFLSSKAVFVPGENVSGEIQLQLDNPVKAKSVRVVLEGKASTEWEVTEKSTDTHSRSSLVPYSANYELVKEEAVVWKQDERRKTLNEGRHQFNFSFMLPDSSPPSKVGHIRYTITAILERPWKTNKVSTAFISVCPAFDLNIIPTAPEPEIFCKTKNIGLVFFRYGKVSIQCSLPKTGYVSGEHLHVDVEINNESSRQIVLLELTLLEISDYVAYRYGAASTRWYGTLDGESSLHQNNRKTDERKITKTDRALNIEPRSSQTVNMTVPIPPCLASFDSCPIIHTKHTVEVKVTAKGSINTSARCFCPVIIGTIPLANSKSGRLTAIAAHKELEVHRDLEPSYEPCQYLASTQSETFTPLVPYHGYMLAEKETPRIT